MGLLLLAVCLLVLLGGFAAACAATTESCSRRCWRRPLRGRLPRRSTGCGRCPRSRCGCSPSAEPRSRDPRARPPAGRGRAGGVSATSCSGRRGGRVPDCSRYCLRGSRSLRRTSKRAVDSMHAGDCANARSEARRALELVEHRATPHHVIAWCLLAEERPAAAARELDEALEQDPDSWSSSTPRRSRGPPRGSTPALSPGGRLRRTRRARSPRNCGSPRVGTAREPERALCAGSASRSRARRPVIRTFSRLSRGRRRGYTRAVRALRHAAVIMVVILAIGCAAALAVASGGGSSRGDSGHGQYGTKPDCQQHQGRHSKKRHSSADSRWRGCPKRAQQPHGTAPEDEIRPTRESPRRPRPLLMSKWPANTTASTQ